MARRVLPAFLFLASVVLAFVLSTGHAQGASPPSPEWLVFTRENSDLPDDNVLSLALDRNDVLWIGTKFEGLASFDGENWGHFRPPEIPGLPNPGGLNGNTGSTSPRPVPKSAGPQAQAFYDLTIDSKGVKWVGTKIAGIKRFDGKTWTWYHTTNSDIPNDYAWNVLIDPQDRVWVGTKYAGVAIFDGQTWTVLDTSNSPLPSDDLTCLALDHDGSIWIGTTKGIAVLKNEHWRILDTSNSGLPVDHVEVIAVDLAGGKWIGTWGGGLAYFDGENWQVYTPENSGLPDLYIWSMTIDNADIKWIGTYARGLVRFDGTNWRVFNSQNSPLPHDMVYDVVVDHRGNTWVATLLGLAVYRSGGVILQVSSPEPGRGTVPTIESISPNPVRNHTVILVRVPQTTYVQIRLFDLLGRPVRKLLEGSVAAGEYPLRWKGTDDQGRPLPSGIYFCVLRTARATQTRRVVLLR